jgi:hypothetical protein
MLLYGDEVRCRLCVESSIVSDSIHTPGRHTYTNERHYCLSSTLLIQASIWSLETSMQGQLYTHAASNQPCAFSADDAA